MFSLLFHGFNPLCGCIGRRFTNFVIGVVTCRSLYSKTDVGAMGNRDADYEDFLTLRKHVRKLQQGTPLLLNTLGGQEDLQICSLTV